MWRTKKVFNIKCLSNIEMCPRCFATFKRKKHPPTFQIKGIRIIFLLKTVYYLQIELLL